jgi:uncharacterized protein (UPF0333 family)
MTVKAINDLAGPNSIILILLVFGVYSWLTKINPSSSLVTKRAEAICAATKEVCRLYAKRQVKNVFVIRNSLNIKNILDLLL